MRIMIVGKNGQLGSDLMQIAKDNGFEVFSFGHEDLDVTDEKSLKEKIEQIKPDILFNAAAYNLIPQAEENPLDAFRINCFAVYYMAKICKENDVKFVTYTTDYVFDGKKEAPYKESDPTNPLQMYGLSKVCGENAAMHAYPEGTYIIRPCAVYGGEKGSRAKGGNIVLTIIKNAKEKEYLEMSDDQFINPTYSKDLAIKSIEQMDKSPKPGIYHLASTGYCNWYEFAIEILKIIEIDKEVRKVSSSKFSSNVKKPQFSALLNTKAKKLGIE
ncbi:MAG: dTDP-4-dehydrorhamnose reductase, partial [Candidatus Levybacteria bacterium]|nr:dTDP-4-dehydrorhamnose reductase [Candidatus Levybacteria bacterium]